MSSCKNLDAFVLGSESSDTIPQLSVADFSAVLSHNMGALLKEIPSESAQSVIKMMPFSASTLNPVHPNVIVMIEGDLSKQQKEVITNHAG